LSLFKWLHIASASASAKPSGALRGSLLTLRLLSQKNADVGYAGFLATIELLIDAW